MTKELEKFVRTNYRKRPLANMFYPLNEVLGQSVPKNRVRYEGIAVFGNASTGKTCFTKHALDSIITTTTEYKFNQPEYNIIYSYIDMVKTIKYLDTDKEVNVLVLDDRYLTYSKYEFKKKSREFLAAIQRKYQDYKGSRGALVFVFFVTSRFDLPDCLNRFIRVRVFRSISGDKQENERVIKSLLGDRAFEELCRLDKKMNLGNHSEMSKSILVKNNYAGILEIEDFPIIELITARVNEKITILSPKEDTSLENLNTVKSVKSVKNVKGETLIEYLIRITIEELEKDSTLLEKAQRKIGKTTLQRNIKFYYWKYWLGLENEDINEMDDSIKSKESARQNASKVKTFLKKNRSLRTGISERAFQEQLTTELNRKMKESTEFPPSSFVVLSGKDCSFLPDQRVRHRHSPDLVLLTAPPPPPAAAAGATGSASTGSGNGPPNFEPSPENLLAFLEIKWHFERYDFVAEPGYSYLVSGLPAYQDTLLFVAAFDSLHQKTFLRCGSGCQLEWKMNSVDTFPSFEAIADFILKTLSLEKEELD